MRKNLNLMFALMMAVSATAFITGCESAGKKTAFGAGAGAAAGAVFGAVLSKDKKKGALLGAMVGGAVGGTIGNRLDKQQKELDKIAETRRTEQGLVTKLKSDILFDTGKHELKPAAETNIDKLAAIMKKYPENVLTINGYTDSTGSLAVNKKISESRAQSVKTRLILGGVPASTIAVVGKGPAAPISDNSTEEGRQQNRRVEIEITVDESKVPEEKKK